MSRPPVQAVRVTFFPGIRMPWVEVWTKDAHSGDFTLYPYYDINRPQCETQGEWLALLATGQTTCLAPPEPPHIYNRGSELDVTWVPGADGEPVAIPELHGPKESDRGFIEDGWKRPPSESHAQLVVRAKEQHDRECGCDPKYLMSCPRMAQAILDCRKP